VKVHLTSLGCDKNLVDAEEMLGKLLANGYEFADDPADAEVIIVNTCCFIGDAQEESVNTILELAEYKHMGICKAFVVTGCLAERFNKDIMPEIPEIDCVLGTTHYDSIVEAVANSLNGNKVLIYGDISRKMNISHERTLTTGGHYAYLKISEGCDKCCSYCIIPSVRGRYRSFPMEDIVDQARRLATGGVKELILVAQETTLYGKDLYGHKSLSELLHKLNEIEELEWIRLLYCYPEEIDDELINALRTIPKLCHYLDMPIQHGSDSILKRMGRRTCNSNIRDLINRLRSEIPDIALRTTFISGFPGETSEDHDILKAFVSDMKFDRMGVFTYSREEGTKAAEFEDQVDEEIKEARKEELMLIQQEICFEHSRNMIGRTLRIMIEGYLPEDEVYVGRTYMDAPDVDGYVFVNSPCELMSGDFVDVLITDSMEYDLIGDVINDQ